MKPYKPGSKLTLFKLDKTRPDSETITYSLVDWGPLAYIKVSDGEWGEAIISLIAKRMRAEIKD